MTNLAFALSFMICCYCFFRSVMLDPGACPKPADESELKSVSRLWRDSRCYPC